MSIRIVIADDHGVLRAGLRSLLNAAAGLEVVGEASSGDETLQRVEALHPEVLLLDISMPGPNGIEVTAEVKRRHPDIAVLILTVHEDETLLQEAIRAGAAGYIIKRAAEAELINAIQAVVRGDLYIHPALTRTLFKDFNTPPPPPLAALKTLTRREIEVLRLIAQGHTNRQIADALFLSVRTIESHRASIMGKLGFTNRVELVHYAMDNHLLEE